MAHKCPTILCVDDELSPLHARTLLLQSAGYEVIACTSPGEALTIFKTQNVHLVLSDHLLPAMSGMHLATEMKRLKPKVPIVLFSGELGESEDAMHADLFITKGDSPQHLLDSLAKLLKFKYRQFDFF